MVLVGSPPCELDIEVLAAVNLYTKSSGEPSATESRGVLVSNTGDYIATGESHIQVPTLPCPTDKK